ncbi:MAG: hypothetical protein KTR32_32000 [Granulosicoccus sp.]|nr:hypothetical protein [Granulosicoccus sp.]
MALANSPDLKLLEFLGQWEDSDGQWIDPLVLMEESLEAGDPAESDAPDEGERSGDKP